MAQLHLATSNTPLNGMAAHDEQEKKKQMAKKKKEEGVGNCTKMRRCDEFLGWFCQQFLSFNNFFVGIKQNKG